MNDTLDCSCTLFSVFSDLKYVIFITSNLKKIFMLKKYFYFAMLMCASTFTFASCSDDDNEAPATPDESIPADEQVETSFTENPRAFALKFHDYIGGGENIKRLDDDTVRIEINEGLLTYLQISELRVGDALNIWENIDCPPYIRVVDAVERTASGYIVTTHEGHIGDLLQSFEGCFDTELYSDVADRPMRLTKRSSNKEDDYLYVDSEEDFDQFVDEEGKIHPFIIYSPSADDPEEYDYTLAEHKYDEMLDSMLQTRLVSWDKTWHLINKKKEHINIYPERDEKGDPVGIFVSDASLEVKADLEIYFQLNVFESNRFWAKLSGGVNVEAPIHLRFAGKQLKKEKEIPVFEFTPVFSAFALGPFVIPVVIRNGFIFKYSGSVDANLSMMVPFYYDATFETGPKYEDGQWGSFKGFEWHAGIDYEKLSVVPSASLSLKAGAGFYFHTGAYFGGAIGPYFEIGPQAEVSANASLSGNSVIFNTKGNVSIGGEVGAEIKIWKFDLGKKKIPYTIASKDIWDIDLRFNQKDIIGAMKP